MASVRYVGSIPEYHGRVGCVEPDTDHPGRSVIFLWAEPFVAPAQTLRNVRPQSIDLDVTQVPGVACPCGRGHIIP